MSRLRKLAVVLLMPMLFYGALQFAVMIAASYSTELNASWLRVFEEDKPIERDRRALRLTPGRMAEVFEVARRLKDRFRVRLQLDILDFQGFTFGVVTTNEKPFELTFTHPKDDQLFQTGKPLALEAIKTAEGLELALNGSIYLREPLTNESIDRVYLQVNQSTMNMTLLEVDNLDEKGKVTIAAVGPFQQAPMYRWIKLGFILAGLVFLLVAFFIGYGSTRWRKIDGAEYAMSWLRCTAPLIFILGMLAKHDAPEFYLRLPIVFWVLLRIRFWLLQRGAFADDKIAPRRIIPAAMGVIATGFVLYRAGGSDGIAALIALSVVVMLGGGLYAFARAMQMTFKQGAAIVGPAFVLLIFQALLVIKNQPKDLASLATLLPFGTLMLTLPLSANRYRLRHYGVFALAVWALCLLSFEYSLRYGSFASRLQPMGIGSSFQTDRDLFWVPKGFFSYTGDFTDRDDFFVRRIAFRGREKTTPDKEPNIQRILVMGGSNVYGDGQSSNATTFVGLLETDLRAKGIYVETLNGGVPGFGSFQSMVLLEKYALAYKPDLVVLYMARNDVAFQSGPYTYRELWKASQSGHRKFSARLQDVLRRSLLYNGLTQLIVGWRDKARAQWYDPGLWKNVNPITDFEKNIRDMIAASRKAGAQAVLVTEFWGEPFVYDVDVQRIGEMNETMKRVAREMNVPLLDAYGHFAATPDPLIWVFPHDPVHLNAEGHAAMAQLIAHFLVEQKLVGANQ